MGLENHSYSTKLSVDEIVTLAKAEHNRWNAFHILNGWKKMSVDELLNRKEQGTKPFQKIPEKKLHSCLVSWEELDNVSKAMNHDYKSDDIETIMRIPSLEEIVGVKK
ncbi:MAG: hypothetical protein U9N59_12635, partial [Campylobacterota bacterium]|nr:hypothetical protein [Campylobacterota bacterium]